MFYPSHVSCLNEVVAPCTCLYLKRWPSWVWWYGNIVALERHGIYKLNCPTGFLLSPYSPESINWDTHAPYKVHTFMAAYCGPSFPYSLRKNFKCQLQWFTTPASKERNKIILTFVLPSSIMGYTVLIYQIGQLSAQLTYSAFANSCPLQTDTFLFPLIHSPNIVLSSNKL